MSGCGVVVVASVRFLLGRLPGSSITYRAVRNRPATSDLAGRDGAEGAPHAHAQGAFREQQDQQGDDPHQVVLTEVGVDLEAEQVERRHRGEAERAAREAQGRQLAEKLKQQKEKEQKEKEQARMMNQQMDIDR